MASKDTDTIREEMEHLQEVNRQENIEKFAAMQEMPEIFGLGTFVAENILLETEIDDSGTIDISLLGFEAQNFPKLRKDAQLAGGRITKPGFGVPGLEEFNEKDPSVFDALPREEGEKPRDVALSSHIEEHKFPILNEFTQLELLELLKRVKTLLPAVKLKDLDLEEELVLHFLNLKELMNEVLYDEDTPANQKAQIANSCAGLLQQMTKSQSVIYSAERVKRMEVALLKALHGLPQDMLEDFITRYEKTYSEEDL